MLYSCYTQFFDLISWNFQDFIKNRNMPWNSLLVHISKEFDRIYLQFVIFNPWKIPWNWIAFYQNSFVLSPGSLYHLIRRDSGRLSNEAFTSNFIVSSK